MRHRVLMLPAWYPSARYQGETAWAQEIARAISTRHDVRVLAYRMSPGDDQRNLSLVETDEGGIRTIRARYPGMTGRGLPPVQVAAAMAGVRRLRRDGFEPDVIHAHVYIAGIAGLALRRQLGIPLVVTEHYTRVRADDLSPLRKRLATTVYRSADLLTAPSKDLADHVADLSQKPVEAVPNAVDTTIFHPPATKAAREPGAPARLLAVGRLHPNKGISYLLRALAQLREEAVRPTVRVLGEGAERSSIESEIERLQLWDQVELAGAMNRRSVAEEMRSADLLVQPSLYENAPVSLSESLSCGLPAVATDVGGVGEMLDFASGVVVESADAGAFAAGIRTALGRLENYDPGRIAKGASDRYGFDSVSRRWGDIYDSALAGSARTPKP
ncbi:MAG: glycosyltransferase [Solirubrobacterales bacterium]